MAAIIMPPWVNAAEKYLGQKEIAGGRDNPFILKCLQISGAPPDLQHDETAWCRAFGNACLFECGMLISKSLAALEVTRNPSRFVLLDAFKPGCIVIYDRVDPAQPTVPHGHFGFGLQELKSNIVDIAGNVGNCVSIEARGKDKLHRDGSGKLACFYWPV